jgi:hypothetical protein
MGKSTKRGRDETTYEEDDFVENDDGNAPKSKKTKKGPSSKSEAKNWEVKLLLTTWEMEIEANDEPALLRSDTKTCRGLRIQGHEADQHPRVL